jgi:hypothetical protein
VFRDRWHFEVMAAVLDERAIPLTTVHWPARAAVMLGNEFDGLDDRGSRQIVARTKQAQ